MQMAIVTVSLSWNVEFPTLVSRFSYGINNALFWWFWILWYFWGFFLGPFPFGSRCSLSVSWSPSLSWTFLHGAHRFWSGKVWRKDTKALVKQHLLDGTPHPGKCSCHLGVRKNLCAIHVPQVLKRKLHVVSAQLTDKILSFSPADPDRAAVRWTVNKEDLLWAGFVS